MTEPTTIGNIGINKYKTCLDFTNNLLYTDSRRDKCLSCGHTEPEHDADWVQVGKDRGARDATA